MSAIHPSAAPCTCGHLRGDHQVSASRGLHPVNVGICTVPDCPCRRYTAIEDIESRSAA